MSMTRDPDRLIHSFLLEGEDELFDQVYDRVRDGIEQQPQRAFIGPWRIPAMNKIVGLGLAAAAVVVVLIVGAQLLGAPRNNVGGPGDDSNPTPAASVAGEETPVATPSTWAWTGIPEGAFVITGPDDPVQVTVEIGSPGWTGLSQFDSVSKDDDGLDSPQSVGGALLAWAWPAGTGIHVYGDPCQWSTTIPATAATTPTEIAAALEAQAETEVLNEGSTTIGGYTGVKLTLEVPMTYEVPGATREEEFAACDESVYGFYQAEGDSEPTRNAQGPGQIDELWILDVNGSIVILDAAYGPAAPPDLVEEMRALAESATFEAP